MTLSSLYNYTLFRMKRLLVVLFFVAGFSVSSLYAQWGNFGNKIKNQVENKTQQKIQEEIDNAYDKSYDNAKEGATGKGNQKSSGSNSNENNSQNNSNNNQNNSNSNKGNGNPPPSSEAGFAAYGKFDFVPGEKVIALEDFSQDEIGDFPAKWNTNGTGEIVTVTGQQGRWLYIGPQTVIYPEFVTDLPENFTIEFNLACSKPYSYYSSMLNIFFAPLLNPAKNFTNWKQYGGNRNNGVEVSLHPDAAGGGAMGQKMIRTWDETGEEIIKNQTDFPEFNHENKNVVKVSIWRQKTRIRVYVNETKIWDIPKAFNSTAKYNFMGFRVENYGKENAFYISNLRVAVGAPDTRHKFIETGKFSTTGIKFDVNSDKIKGESYGTLKDFATVLQENPSVRVKIVGHTDSDGDDASNLALSKKRADAVKVALNKEFSIDTSRMETEGKGESQPADTNSTPEGKANNRRVEFIKL